MIAIPLPPPLLFLLSLFLNLNFYRSQSSHNFFLSLTASFDVQDLKACPAPYYYCKISVHSAFKCVSRFVSDTMMNATGRGIASVSVKGRGTQQQGGNLSERGREIGKDVKRGSPPTGVLRAISATFQLENFVWPFNSSLFSSLPTLILLLLKQNPI